MKTILRNILAVVIGLVLGGVVNMALVVAGPRIIPPPPGVDLSDAQSLAAGIHLLAPRHFIFPFLAHALGTLAGVLATHLAAATRRTALACLIGALNLAGGIVAACVIPAPPWFIALDLLAAYVPMTWLGTWLGGQLRPGGAGPA
jgi:hypothetical protein